MKDLSKSALSILSWPFAILLLIFTGYQTYTLLYDVSGSHLTAVVGLVLFEIGMLYWWAVFRSEAEGLPQMALSLLVFLACLLFVTMATALKLGAVSSDVMGTDTPAKIITAAAVIQLAAKLFFPLIHPDVWRTIKDKVQEGKLINNAEGRFEKRADAVADRVAEEMAEEWERRLIVKINSKYHLGLPEGETAEVSQNTQTIPQMVPLARPAGRGDNGPAAKTLSGAPPDFR